MLLGQVAHLIVIPAKAGIQGLHDVRWTGGNTTCGSPWIPAFAGMTGDYV
jgi:hypothetical protein